jgi:hypothetical protein
VEPDLLIQAVLVGEKQLVETRWPGTSPSNPQSG